jgi:hypothetical protein
MFKATLHALALAAALAAAPAHALDTTGIACDGQGTTMTSQPGYLDCSGAFDGNSSNQDVPAQILADWGLSGLTVTDVTGANGNATTGSFTFADMASPFVLALKAGDAFSLYLFDAHTTSINFDTLGVGFFSGNKTPIPHFGQGLSHATLYGSSTVTAVPEPETYALLMAGLAFVGWASRRRQRQQ